MKTNVVYLGPYYHYTSISSLEKILKSSSLFATEHRCLNDISERETAIELLKNQLKEFIAKACGPECCFLAKLHQRLSADDYGKVYIASFCTDGDLLSMWRGYGMPQGVCIEFDRSDYNRFDLFNAGFRPPYIAIYDELEQECEAHGTIKWLLEEFRDDKSRLWASGSVNLELALHRLMKSACRFKHAGFSEEKEVRLIITENVSNYPLALDSNGTEIPGKINIFGERQGQRLQLPIKNIIVGPNNNRDDMQDCINSMLYKYHYYDVKISFSNIPFRDNRNLSAP